MNIPGIIGTKIDQTQSFLQDGTRVPVSIVSVNDVYVTQIKHADRDGYTAVQLGMGMKKRATKALTGHSKKAGVKNTPRFFREIRMDEAPDVEAGAVISPADVLEPGDLVDVIGTSKGKGFAGVVKRHGFAGGPRTHGQSDRERAPGSIGQTTTPGRVYRGKRMAGHMGDERVTVEQVQILEIEGDKVMILGLIPGVKGGLVMLRKTGKSKHFTPLYKKDQKQEVREIAVETAEEVITTPEETVETQEDVKTVDETVAEAPEVAENKEEQS